AATRRRESGRPRQGQGKTTPAAKLDCEAGPGRDSKATAGKNANTKGPACKDASRIGELADPARRLLAAQWRRVGVQARFGQARACRTLPLLYRQWLAHAAPGRSVREQGGGRGGVQLDRHPLLPGPV